MVNQVTKFHVGWTVHPIHGMKHIWSFRIQMWHMLNPFEPTITIEVSIRGNASTFLSARPERLKAALSLVPQGDKQFMQTNLHWLSHAA